MTEEIPVYAVGSTVEINGEEREYIGPVEPDDPCRFCGSTDTIRSSLYVDEGTELIPADDVGEIETVHCRRCLAEAPVLVWNNRPIPATTDREGE